MVIPLVFDTGCVLSGMNFGPLTREHGAGTSRNTPEHLEGSEPPEHQEAGGQSSGTAFSSRKIPYIKNCQYLHYSSNINILCFP